MASQALAGFQGQIYVRTALGLPGDEFLTTDKVAEMRDVTLNIDADSIDVSSHDSVGWKEAIGGLKQWTASVEEIYVASDVVQNRLYDALIARTQLFFRIAPKGASAVDNVDDVWEGQGVVLKWELGMPNSDAQISKVEIQGAGGLVRKGAGSGWGWG